MLAKASNVNGGYSGLELNAMDSSHSMVAEPTPRALKPESKPDFPSAIFSHQPSPEDALQGIPEER
jgi:hypothetical protein